MNLFWALFGLTPLSTVRGGEIQPFTKLVGEGLLMAYHAMAIIMLINMLIAMMSNSFQNIEVYLKVDSLLYTCLSYLLSMSTYMF